MKLATVTQAKNGLSALLDRVKAGESIVITERGRPIARIEPMTATGDADGRLDRLERAGILRRGLAPPPIDLMREPPPKLTGGASIIDAVLEERESGW